MGANGCVQRLDLAEMFIVSMLKLKDYVKMANLFTQARSTCLPWPSLPVYPGLANLFTEAWSTCLPRPGFFSRYGNTLENINFSWFRHLRDSQGSGLSPSDPACKVSMTALIFSQIHNTATQIVMFEVLGP